MENNRLRLGVVGCGGFGLFALQHFAQTPDVVLTTIAGTHREAAIAAAKRFGVAGVEEVFENYAADEGLPPDHWFWDRRKSGGIFIEHGVHFFDLFAGWLGPGRVVAAQRTLRPRSGLEEQVHCTVRYGESALVNFYHGFHQPGRLDRQEFRFLFERGDVTLFDWVPTRIDIHAIADEETTRALCNLFSGARLDVTQAYAAKERVCQGRHKTFDVYQMIELRAGAGVPKMHRYGELLRAMLADQIAWIRDRNHQRRITEQNGRESLAMAEAADELASKETNEERRCSNGSTDN